MAKVQIIETSCNRRELELEQVKNYFYANGYEISKKDFDTDTEADVILLSTCGFTQAAEDFALKTIKRIEKEMKPGTDIYIGGCLPKINKEVLVGYQTFDPRNYEVLDKYFEMEKKFSQFKRPNTISNFQVHPKFREHGIMSTKDAKLDEIGKQTSRENLDTVEEITNIVREKSNSTFRIQCMLGCACKCTYCAIKFAIGPIKSRPPNEILCEIKQGIEKGYSDILLEGDSLGSYGLDIETDLGKLLDEVIYLIKDNSVRISIPDVSPLYLDKCNTQIIKLAKMGKLFNFYTPIQSGSQKILDMMKRGYKIDKAKNIIKAIKYACPELKCGTSLIVGFPGETEEDLNETINICKELRFDYIYCHSYSDRKGTEADKLPNKIPEDIILQRARALKTKLKSITSLITIAEDTAGNLTCQG
jgi:MiaB/RimO family radical SAM methylthiotransferase